MPNLISFADGNFTGAGTWAEADSTAVVSAPYYSFTALTTTPVDGTAFQPGAVTVDGVAVKVVNLQKSGGTPTNKLIVSLRSGGSDIKTVTVNVSDLPESYYGLSAPEGGWHFCKFDAPTLLVAATDYTIRMSLDSTSTAVGMGVDASAGGSPWHHMLRTDVLRAPAATDNLHIMGELDGSATPATPSSRVITMDETATTIYGHNTSNVTFYLPGLDISARGTLNFAHAAATDYKLYLGGSLVVFRGGTLTVGTVANPIPRGSTAVIEFQNVSKTYSMWICDGATLIMQGLSRTSGKDVWSCLLNAGVSIGGTTLGVDTDTGWLSGDTIGVAPTAGVYYEGDYLTLGANAGASSMTVNAATYAHSGTSPTQAEVILLTRNVVIRVVAGQESSMITLNIQAAATVDCDWTYFDSTSIQSLTGTPVTAGGSGIMSMRYCSSRASAGSGGPLYFNNSSNAYGQVASDNFTVQYYGCWFVPNAAGVTVNATIGTNWVMDHITIIAPGTNQSLLFSDLGGTFDYITVAGGFNATFTSYNVVAKLNGTPHITVHSAAYGLIIDGAIADSHFAKITSWRNGQYGLTLGPGVGTDYWSNVVIDEILAFGCNYSSQPMVSIRGYGNFYNCSIATGVIASETSFPSNILVAFVYSGYAGIMRDWSFNNVALGKSPYIAPAVSDFDFHYCVDRILLTCRNAAFSGATPFGNTTTLPIGSVIISARHNQVDGAHQYITPAGTIVPEATTVHTAAPSEKLTPALAGTKLQSGDKQIALNDGDGCTVTVWVRKNSSYTGNAVRLIQRADASIGVNVDTVLDTMTVGADTWEQLSGIVPALIDNGAATVYVDCDGTAGSIFVDDWAVA